MRRQPRHSVLAIVGLVAILVAGLLGDRPYAQSETTRAYYLLAGATTNATIVNGCRPTTLHGADLFSIASDHTFVKFYNQCSTPASTDTPVLVLAIPVGQQTTGTSVGHTAFRPVSPVRFPNGLSFRTTRGIATANDDGLRVASEVVIDLTYN